MELLKIIFLVLLALTILRPGYKADREWLLIQYSLAAKVLMLVMFVFFLILIYSAIEADNGPSLVVYAVLFGFTIASYFSVLETFRHKLWFDNEKIYYQSPYGRRVVLSKDEIATCKIAWFGNEYQFISAEGIKIRITPLMSGGSEFYKEIRNYLMSKNA
jgi:hypothetical protein